MFFIIGFKDSASPIMEGIIDLHNYIFFYLIIILIFVSIILINILIDFGFIINYPTKVDNIILRYNLLKVNKITHNTLLELIWTIIPTIILIYIAIPSFILLYAMDEIIQPSITFKAIGHQWYWSYEYNYINLNLFKKINFDSNLVYESELNLGELRLLQVDKVFVLPINTHINILLTSYDVIHSFALPNIGFKLDAIPGRLNKFNIFVKRQGVFYGQCSELCGVNHGFMPIIIKFTNYNNFNKWVLLNVN